MKRTIMMAAVAAAAILTGCNKNEMNLPQGKTFTATISEQPEICDTKVTFENDGIGGFVINWDVNDYASINGVTYKATTGGGVTTEFVPQYANKTAEENSDSPKWEVYYPYDIKNTKNSTTTDDPDDVWDLYLGTSQVYEENSVNKMPMRAVSDDENLSFRCLTGIIQINLKCKSGSMVIKTIKLQTKDKPLGGPFVVEGDKAVCINTSNTPITLKDEDGITINSDGYTAFNLSAPENEYTSLTITLYDENNVQTAINLRAGKSIIVERGKITSINLTLGAIEQTQDPKTIVYTTSNGNVIANPPVPNGYTIESNVYANGIGVITFNKAVLTISDRAFEGITTLTSITFAESVSKIGNYAFYGCTNLKDVKLPSSLTTIGASSFTDCSCLESIVIPESVTAIHNNAFQNCTSLTSVTMPENAQFTALPQNTFAGCTSLIDVTIPEGVTTLGTKAFEKTAITEITLPSTLTSVGKQGFDGCKSLKNVTVKRYDTAASPDITALTENTYVFRNTVIENIYVPAAAAATYQADSMWSKWADLIKANPAE